MKNIFFKFLLLSQLFLTAADAENEKIKEAALLIEPASFHLPLSKLIPGAKKTFITTGFVEQKKGHDSVVVSFLQPSWKTTRLTFMDDFIQQARSTLSKRLTKLKPHFLRDEHQVIQVAIIDDQDPLTASTILAPDFVQQFTPIFGPTFLVALPTTHRIYIFSKLASPLDEIASVIRNDYQSSLSPLSLEIFELGPEKLHAVGTLEDRR